MTKPNGGDKVTRLHIQLINDSPQQTVKGRQSHMSSVPEEEHPVTHSHLVSDSSEERHHYQVLCSPAYKVCISSKTQPTLTRRSISRATLKHSLLGCPRKVAQISGGKWNNDSALSRHGVNIKNWRKVLEITVTLLHTITLKTESKKQTKGKEFNRNLWEPEQQEEGCYKPAGNWCLKSAGLDWTGHLNYLK